MENKGTKMNSIEEKYCKKAIDRMTAAASYIYGISSDNRYKVFGRFTDLIKEYVRLCREAMEQNKNFVLSEEEALVVTRENAKNIGRAFGRIFGEAFETPEKRQLISEFCRGAFGVSVSTRAPRVKPEDTVAIKVVESKDLSTTSLRAEDYVKSATVSGRTDSKSPNKSNKPKIDPHEDRLVPRY